MGYDFSEEEDAHSATNDTYMTITIFKDILNKNSGGILNKEILETFAKTYEIEKENNAEAKAKGILSLCKNETGYTLKNNAYRNQELESLSIIVNSRYVAEHKIREKFKRKEIGQNSGIYNLKPIDIEFFLGYSNIYNATIEEFYRNIYNAKRSRKKRLNFNFI